MKVRVTIHAGHQAMLLCDVTIDADSTVDAVREVLMSRSVLAHLRDLNHQPMKAEAKEVAA